MTVRVDPDQLDGYAVQLERNAGYFVDPLRAYCAAHCAHTEGMTGLLAAVRPMVELGKDAMTGLFASGERNLYQVALNLRSAATAYRAHDELAAEKVWLAVPRRHAPAGYTGRDDLRHPGDYADPYPPQLVAPVKRDDFHHTIAEAKRALGEIEEWSTRYAHFSVAESMAHYLAGDWDTLRLNAAGYAGLATRDGVLTIRENLRHGIDSLSVSWDGPAATEFDFTIRARWVPAIEAVQHGLELHKELFELLARVARQTYETFVLALEALRHWVVEKCLRIVRLVAAAVHVAHVWREVVGLVEHLVRFSHDIALLFEILRQTIETVAQAVRAAGAELAAIDDMWAPGGNRLEPVRSG